VLAELLLSASEDAAIGRDDEGAGARRALIEGEDGAGSGHRENV
jgi:hypothetical protein